MLTAEIRVSDKDLASRLAEMRAWLDEKRFEPSTFRYLQREAELLIRVSFKVGDEARAFALKFGGFLHSPPASEMVLRDFDGFPESGAVGSSG